MASDSGIPVVGLGIDGAVAHQVSVKLLPEYDVVHICTNIPDAKAELTRLISGDLSVVPSSGYGSNLQRQPSDRKIPKLVLIGAGFTDDDHQELQKAIGEKSEGVTYVKVRKEDLEKGGSTVEKPSADWIANNIREKLSTMGYK